MNSSQITAEEREVLRRLFLPAISPAADKTVRSVARRSGLSPVRVFSILESLEQAHPRLVRRASSPGTEEFWIAQIPRGVSSDNPGVDARGCRGEGAEVEGFGAGWEAKAVELMTACASRTFSLIRGIRVKGL